MKKEKNERLLMDWSIGRSANVKLNQGAFPPRRGCVMLPRGIMLIMLHPSSIRSKFETTNFALIIEGHLKALSPNHRHRISLV